MRKTLIALSAVAAVAFTGAAHAQSRYYAPSANPALPVAGAVVGTGVGIAAHEAWWGAASNSSLATSFAGSAAGAAVAGGVAGIGAIALIDAATQPCAGFRALFSPFIPGPSGCVNGEFVGYQQAERVNRRHHRR